MGPKVLVQEDQEYSNKRKQLNFEKDLQKIEDDLLKEKELEQRRRMDEIRKKGAFKEKSWKDTKVRRDDVTNPRYVDYSDLRAQILK